MMSLRRVRPLIAGTSALLLLTVGLSACSSAEDAPASSGPADCSDFSQTLKVAQSPVTDFAPVWVAVEEGIFKKHGITAELAEPSGTGAESVALINSGQVDLVPGSPSAMLSAASQGILTQVVTGMTVFPDDEDRDPAAVVVAAGSDLTSLKDLEGKTVGITSLNSQQQSKVMGSVAADGGDPSSIEFVQVPTASMGALVASGELDAAQPFEPVGTTLLQSGDFEAIGYANWQVLGGVPAMFLTSTPDWIAKNECAAEATSAAIAEAVDFINDDANRDRFIEILASYQKVDVELMAQARTDDFTVEIDKADYERLVEHLMEYGVLQESVDVGPLLGG